MTFILRTFTAILAILSIHSFIRSNIGQFQASMQKTFYFWSFFLWLLPVICIRFSSETWSGLLFMLGLAQINAEEEELTVQKSWKTGVLLGLSFLCRFQSGLLFAGLFFWLLLIKKESLRNLSYLALSWIGVLLLGIVLDWLFYGTWTLTAWNYFNVNILMDIASSFGKVKWYKYIGDILLDAVAPVGLMVLSAYLLLLFRNPRDKIIWTITPFLLVHLIIPHKEIRFLFPVAIYAPYIVFKAIQSFNPGPASAKLMKLIHMCFLSINLLSLITAIFIVPSNGRIAITQFIYNHYRHSRVQLYVMNGNNPFVPFKTLKQRFYEMPALKHTIIKDYSDLESIPFSEKNIHLLIIRKKDLIKDPALENRLLVLKFKEIKSGSPRWATTIYSLYNSGAQLQEYRLYAY
nr:hypothetical protein [Chitinophaga sp. XS-30]